ncbi:hypothetical protein [Methanolobus bombayensis]|uniref:hypothetical protein n=1 Tax=Methanolobus bombayensis TaxID=38023 RepID=UPI001AE4FBBC|nr:hypothetical protein [Methanolobus bombayensis]MBP1910142.1 hypothetical protein [Methanolobus bombayensis]
MNDSIKIYKNHSEILFSDEQTKKKVGRAMHDLFENTLNGFLFGAIQATTVYYHDGCYPVEECGGLEYDMELMEAIRISERHPESLKINFKGLPDYVVDEFEIKAEETLDQLKKEGVF